MFTRIWGRASLSREDFPAETFIMKTPSRLVLILLIVSVCVVAEGQSVRSASLLTRPRTVSGTQLRASAKFQEPAKPAQAPARPPEVLPAQREDASSSHRLSPAKIRARIEQAE